jgi:hypothetical protein
VTAIERARYKLRQAELILSYLRQVPKDIAADLRRARSISDPNLGLDAFFFSCLSLAKSAYYIIKDDQGRRYADAIHSWRMNVDLKGRAQFNKMMKLRDIDVHQGRSEGKTHETMIPIERSSGDDSWMYQQQPNYAALGIIRPATEQKMPDGSTVSSYYGLQGSKGMYVDIAGEPCEVSNACERFISQLRSLIDALEAANVPPLNPVQRLWLWFRRKLGILD